MVKATHNLCRPMIRKAKLRLPIETAKGNLHRQELKGQANIKIKVHENILYQKMVQPVP
jgi:hypothetical protein